MSNFLVLFANLVLLHSDPSKAVPLPNPRISRLKTHILGDIEHGRGRRSSLVLELLKAKAISGDTTMLYRPLGHGFCAGAVSVPQSSRTCPPLLIFFRTICQEAGDADLEVGFHFQRHSFLGMLTANNHTNHHLVPSVIRYTEESKSPRALDTYPAESNRLAAPEIQASNRSVAEICTPFRLPPTPPGRKS